MFKPKNSNTMKTSSLLLISMFILWGLNAQAQEKDSLIKVSEGVYQITGYVGNISFLATNDGVVLFDAGNRPDGGERILDLVATVTSKPLKAIVITHYHWDHTNGLASLPGNVPVIAAGNTKTNQQNRVEELKSETANAARKVDSLKFILDKIVDKTSGEYKKADSTYKAANKEYADLKATKIIYPTELVDDSKTLVVGQDTILLLHPGKAHTNGDLVAVIKTRKVMVLGDLLFNHLYPYIDPLGDVQNWATQLQKYATFDVNTYIPGHAMAATRQDVLTFAQYLTDMRAEVIKMHDAGKSLDEMKKTLKLPAYESFGFKFFWEQNIEAVYNQVYAKK